MKEKTEYIKVSIDILEARDELNADELAVLCNLKKFMHQSDTPPFAVGEYYFDKDVNRIVKIEHHETNYTEIKYLSDGKLQNSVLYNLADYFDKWQPATAEQIATFKRAEQFAAKGRKWSEFKKGDIVQNTKTMQLGLVESVDEDGDALVNYDMDVPLIYPNCPECTGALFLNLIQTAEELQEVGEL